VALIFETRYSPPVLSAGVHAICGITII